MEKDDGLVPSADRPFFCVRVYFFLWVSLAVGRSKSERERANNMELQGTAEEESVDTLGESKRRGKRNRQGLSCSSRQTAVVVVSFPQRDPKGVSTLEYVIMDDCTMWQVHCVCMCVFVSMEERGYICDATCITGLLH